jgi:hypothetical protein
MTFPQVHRNDRLRCENHVYATGARIDEPLLIVEGAFISEVTSRSRREIPEHCRHFDFAEAVLAPAFIEFTVALVMM